MSDGRRLRLLGVTVQARFAVDDGATLTEVMGPPVPVAAAEWRTFADESFTDDDLTRILAAFDAQQPDA